MPAKWQQWMPFHIDRFKASPAVQAMHPIARIGYLYLLACSWQSEDCTIPADDDFLSELSGLGELWEAHSSKILRKFVVVDGRLRNPCCYEEWREAKRIFESRQAGAKRTNAERSAYGERAVSERRADTITLTGTVTDTNTEVQKQKPTSAHRVRAVDVKVKKKTKTDLRDARYVSFKEAIRWYWDTKNKGMEMPWGPPDGKQLGIWLTEVPSMTLEQFRNILRNRLKSDLNHSARVSTWIRKATAFINGPIDRYGMAPQVNGGSNGKNNGFSGSRSKTAGNFAEAESLLRELDNQETNLAGDSETGFDFEGHASPIRE